MDLNMNQQLAELLKQGRFLSQEQIDLALKIATEQSKTLEEVILEKELMPSENLGRLISNLKNWKFVKLDVERIDPNVVKMIPEDVARKQKVLAFADTPQGIKVALTNPDDSTLVHDLSKTLGKPVVALYATSKDIRNSFKYYHSNITEDLTKIISDQDQENSIIKLVDLLLQRGYEQNASDIHIEPGEEQSLIRFRVDGSMQDIARIPSTLHDAIISRIKVMSHLRTDEHQVPQDGKLQFEADKEFIDVRVSVVPTTLGENAVMRLLSERAKQFTIEELGFSQADLQKIQEITSKPWGTVLVTGPTGSGKTTTLYSMLKKINKREVKIATIEDPVEYQIEGVSQIQVNPKAKLNFATGLKSIVRQDPDAIMIGEIRDKETASIAINSAMTGHLVLSTLHTNDAATTLPRLIDMDIEPFLVASTINIIVAQRLVRKICSKCVESYDVELKDLADKVPVSILEKLAQNKDKITVYQGAGCEICNHTGYHGRTGVFEIMLIDSDITRLIMDNADADTIEKKAIENGMTTMFEDAKDKVLNGITTLEEMLRVIQK